MLTLLVEQESRVTEKKVVAHVPGIGSVYNRVSQIAEAEGLSIGDLARVAQIGHNTAKRIWNNAINGIEFATLLKITVALNRTFDEVFPMVKDERYYNPYTYGDEGDIE